MRQNHPPPHRPGESEAHKRRRKKAGKSAVAWAVERHPPSLAPGGGTRTALMQAAMIGHAKAMKKLLAGPVTKIEQGWPKLRDLAQNFDWKSLLES
jgi:hypothetical protein